MIAKPDRPGRAAKRAALDAPRRGGCVCNPVVRITWRDDVPLVRLYHDAWCPLTRSHEGGGPRVDIVLAPKDGDAGS
jgi:hypothetical protein